MERALGMGNFPPSPDVDGVMGDDRAALRGGLAGTGIAGELLLFSFEASFD